MFMAILVAVNLLPTLLLQRRQINLLQQHKVREVHYNKVVAAQEGYYFFSKKMGTIVTACCYSPVVETRPHIWLSVMKCLAGIGCIGEETGSLQKTTTTQPVE